LTISEHFDDLYAADQRYWWRREDPYSADPDAYRDSLLTQLTLRLIRGLPPGRALDLGAGEGADSIRLARLGYDVTAVEISCVGAEKIGKFASDAGVQVTVDVADLADYEPHGEFDLVICNGVLHYIADKEPVIEMMQRATRTRGLNVISLWSTHTPVPECHAIVPSYRDDEDGVLAKLYLHWDTELHYYERDKPDAAHLGMPKHSHSHIKAIFRKPVQG
jgi:SAM-dependent methyltransferase